MREPSTTTTKRPHSWTLTSTHPLIGNLEGRPIVHGPASLGKVCGRFRATEATTLSSSSTARAGGGVMASRNADTYRIGHEAFNQRDFVAMTSRYADSITW